MCCVVVRDLQVVHGMMMFVFWGVNIVIGGAIARYYKNTRHWFQIHKFFQLVNTFLTIPIFLLTLGFVPAEARFRTTHGKLGYSIVFLSLFQAFLGNTSHVLNKISKGLLKHCETSETISPEVLEMVEAVKPIPINVVKKRRDFFENWSHRRSMLSERHKDEVDKIVKDYLTKVYFLMSQIPYFLSIISFLVKHVNQNHIRKMHRLLGRIFLLLGITQIALGLRVLKVESSVEIIIWTWISLCLFIIVYKEIERFFQLPLGVYPKLVFGYNSFCGGDWQVPGAQSFLGEQTFDHKHEDKQRRFSKRGSNKPRSENKSANNKKNMEKVNSFDINQDTKDIDTSYMSFGSTEHHRTRLRKNVTEGGYPNDFMERLRQAEAKGAHDDVIELSIQGVEHRPTSMIIDDNDNVDARTKTSFAMTDD
uniref:Cytochrome b561 domain-containing protein n=1 Tax=Aplanochytrium stocchinoi TaxID=215587 RepID=A0A7S3PMC8_9STRA|mmetsp:Transcript_1164/g.1735  ORF Transcript_1164/g.1735 Transcript_1164/m.1735 type:complete len:421 (-) Transcript_1164:803-2065(-)